jgi:hypothetical protein
MYLKIQRRLQIGGSSDCSNNCSRSIFNVQQNSSFTRPWSARSCCMAVRHGCSPKRRRTNSLCLSGKICVPKLDNGVYRRRHNFQLEREFNSPCVINVVKTNKLRYADHITGKPTTEGYFYCKIARKTEILVDGWGKQRWRTLGALDWTHRDQDREQWKEILWQALTVNWL